MELSIRIKSKRMVSLETSQIDKVFALGMQIGELHFNLTEPFLFHEVLIPLLCSEMPPMQSHNMKKLGRARIKAPNNLR